MGTWWYRHDFKSIAANTLFSACINAGIFPFLGGFTKKTLMGDHMEPTNSPYMVFFLGGDISGSELSPNYISKFLCIKLC